MFSETRGATTMAPDMRKTLLIGESGGLIREALKCWVEKIPAVEKVYAAATSNLCLDLARHVSPALAILPLHFGKDSGVELAIELKQFCPEVKIAFWIGNVSDLLLCEVLACQPVGLVSIRDAPERVAETIEKLLFGIPAYSSLLGERVLKVQKHLASSKRKDIIGLTPRQEEVLRYLALGHTVKEVASQMHLSAKSIDSHKYRIMKKLGIHDRVHLTRFAIREGLIET